VLDAVIQRWMGEYGNLWLRLDWNRRDYRRYLSCLAAWAEELATTPAKVEEAMFRDRVGPGSQFAVDTDRDLASLLDEVDEALTVAMAERGRAEVQEARAHVDALCELLE
jgi:hypothetical protein